MLFNAVHITAIWGSEERHAKVAIDIIHAVYNRAYLYLKYFRKALNDGGEMLQLMYFMRIKAAAEDSHTYSANQNQNQ